VFMVCSSSDVLFIGENGLNLREILEAVENV
jgi:hypothetical protein